MASKNNPIQLARFILGHWKGILKFAFVAALLVLLAKKGFISLDATRNAFAQPRVLLPGMALLVLLSLSGAIRWQWLLRAQNLNIRWSKALQLTYVGNFFNITLPGAVSGDFVKAYYVAKEIQGRRGHAFGAILFDRLAGLSALVLVSAGALLVDFHALKGTPLLRAIQVMITIAAAGVVFFYGYLFLVNERRDPVLKIFLKLEQSFPRCASLRRIYEGLRHYHNHRWTVIKSLILSILTHMGVCLCCIFFAHALGEPNLPSSPIFVIVPLGLLVTAVPVMPAGVGTGHAAFGWLFHYLGTLRGADIFSLYALCQFIVGGIGGLVYLQFRSREPAPTLPSEESNELAPEGP